MAFYLPSLPFYIYFQTNPHLIFQLKHLFLKLLSYLISLNFLFHKFFRNLKSKSNPSVSIPDTCIDLRLIYAVFNELYLQLFLFTLDQPAGQIRAGAS